MPRRIVAIGVVGALLASGCSRWTGPTEVSVAPGEYDQSMQSAIGTLQRMGFRCAVIDRDAGVVESESVRSSTLVEPWRTDNATWGDVTANTVSQRRRQIRLNWVPVGDAPKPVSSATLPGPTLPGQTAPTAPVDLSRCALRLTAVVAVEQQYTPGDRLNTYSSSLSSTYQEPRPAREGTVDRGTWTPVGRDEAYEQRVLAKILAASPTNTAKSADSVAAPK